MLRGQQASLLRHGGVFDSGGFKGLLGHAPQQPACAVPLPSLVTGTNFRPPTEHRPSAAHRLPRIKHSLSRE